MQLINMLFFDCIYVCMLYNSIQTVTGTFDIHIPAIMHAEGTNSVHEYARLKE